MISFLRPITELSLSLQLVGLGLLLVKLTVRNTFALDQSGLFSHYHRVMSNEQKKIAGLEVLAKNVAGKGPPPVDRWNPPYCGDIGLAIRCDGTWTYGGSPINRMSLVKLFASILRRDDDGAYYLVTPAEKVLCKVEDAPFLAVEMEVWGSGSEQEILIRTNVDDVVAGRASNPIRFQLDKQHGSLKPYILVRGRLEALFTRSLTYELLDRCGSVGPGGHPGIWTGGAFFPIPQY
jgi:hypothetical protein